MDVGQGGLGRWMKEHGVNKTREVETQCGHTSRCTSRFTWLHYPQKVLLGY